MLLVLKPFALIFFSIRERIDTIALPAALNISAFVYIAALEDRLSLAIRLAS